jgi:hypothetical protein
MNALDKAEYEDLKNSTFNSMLEPFDWDTSAIYRVWVKN